MSKLLIIGIGPGDASSLTEKARSALAEADLICGYNLYVDLVRPLFPEKDFFATGMTGEVERCRVCLEEEKQLRLSAAVMPGFTGWQALLLKWPPPGRR